MALDIIDAANEESFGTSVALDVAATLPAGTLVVIGAISDDGAATLDSITDLGSNSYTIRADLPNANASDSFAFNTAYCYLTSGLSVGSNRITVTFSGGTVAAGFIAVSDADSTPLDQENDAVDDAFPPTATATSGPITTTQADEILVGFHAFLITSPPETFTPSTSPTSWTEAFQGDSPGSVLQYMMEYLIVSSTGTYNTDAAISSSFNYWSSRIMSFKASGGTPPITDESPYRHNVTPMRWR